MAKSSAKPVWRRKSKPEDKIPCKVELELAELNAARIVLQLILKARRTGDPKYMAAMLNESQAMGVSFALVKSAVKKLEAAQPS